jgi:tetratricopeptide (TPR) repeat protein
VRFAYHARRITALAVLGTFLGLAGWWYGWPAYQWWTARQAVARGDLDGAEKGLAALLRAVPDRAEAHFLHAHVLRKLKRFPEAQAALGRAQVRGLPRTEATRREAALIGAGLDFRPSEPALRALLEAAPADLEVIQALAKGYVNQLRLADAERAYGQWLRMRPADLDALLGRGQARMRTGRWNEAIADFQALLQQAPVHFHARLLLADCLLSSFRVEETEPELLTCRQLRPDRPEPLVGLAICATGQGDLDRAQKLLTEARTLEPGSPVVLQNLGDHYLLRRRYDLAEGFFAEVVRLDPRDKAAHLKLAQALRKNGRGELGREHERRYLDLDAEEARQQGGLPGPDTP